MAKTDRKVSLRRRRKRRIRKRIQGTAERPRLTVFRSNSHIYAQIVDDRTGQTLASANDLHGELPALEGDNAPTAKRGKAYQVGLLVAQKAKESGLGAVIFDRNGYIYHGRVQSLADGARKGGLEF